MFKVPQPTHRRRLIRLVAISMGFWLLLVAVPSSRPVRSFLCWPLYVHDPEAVGEAAYVMAGGEAYFERLRAASDLFHMHRVKEIVLLEDLADAGHSFVENRSQTRIERAVNYLELLGVPTDKVRSIPEQQNVSLGSLSEARSFASLYSTKYDSVVVVTSAPHTRRSILCFRRSLPENVRVTVFAASSPEQSAELFWPLWHEYVKLIVYSLVA